MDAHDDRVSVVIATRNRPAELARTLDQLAALRPRPRVIVVDNASTSGSGGTSTGTSTGRTANGFGWLRDHPAVHDLVLLDRNRGAAARTIGAQRAPTPYVAFSDDDSWWAPDALPAAADALDRHPRLALVAARTLVGPEQRPDPINLDLAGSPLPAPAVSGEPPPGPSILGCLACAAVVRRDAFLAAGGFSELIFIGGEEALLCYDLAAAGWSRCYLDQVIAHHHPSALRPPSRQRQAVQRRNQVLLAWLRRPLPVAATQTWRLVRDAAGDRVARRALAGLVGRLPAALADRRPLPAAVEEDVRRLAVAAEAPAQASALAPVVVR